jgi:conjugal transfer pilus assembly protein TraE
MDLQKYLKTWKGLNRENTFHRVVLTILALVLVLQQFQLMNDTSAVVMAPPVDLEESAEITQSDASDSYLRGWSLFIAQFLGNVTPKNADIVKDGILPLLSPEVYSSVRESLEQQVVEFRESGMSTSFSIQQIIHEDSTDKYFVVGRQVTRAPAAEPQKERRVYEIKLEIDNYRPVVTHLTAYTGRPRLKDAETTNQEG